MTRSRDNFGDDMISVQEAQRSGDQASSPEHSNRSDSNEHIDPSEHRDPVIKKRVPNNISSSISGVDAIGDDVAEKRANLLGAQGSPQLGRRESPEPYDPWPKRKMYIQGMVFGAIVIICVLVTVIALGSGSTIGA